MLPIMREHLHAVLVNSVLFPLASIPDRLALLQSQAGMPDLHARPASLDACMPRWWYGACPACAGLLELRRRSEMVLWGEAEPISRAGLTLSTAAVTAASRSSPVGGSIATLEVAGRGAGPSVMAMKSAMLR